MINLITSFFRPENTERLNELMTCLKNNIDSKYIKKIYLFMKCKEDIEFLKQEIKITRNKIQLILWNKQPFYSDYLNLANQLKGEICMISNADIWLKKCDTDLINLVNTRENIGYALTRHDRDSSGNFKLKQESWNKICGIWASGIGSFDSFIFKSPKLVTENMEHIQNRPGSEHVFKTELEECNMKFYNPSKSIIIIHEHQSNIRNYGEDLLWKKDSKYFGYTYTPRYKKRLTITPPILKSQLINELNSYISSGKTFKPMSALFGRH